MSCTTFFPRSAFFRDSILLPIGWQIEFSPQENMFSSCPLVDFLIFSLDFTILFSQFNFNTDLIFCLTLNLIFQSCPILKSDCEKPSTNDQLYENNTNTTTSTTDLSDFISNSNTSNSGNTSTTNTNSSSNNSSNNSNQLNGQDSFPAGGKYKRFTS